MTASVLLGIINGLNISLLALGLVLVYKANRFVNFAHAQLGVVAALVLAKLSIDWGVPWLLAFLAAVALGAATGALVEAFVIRRLATRDRLSLLIATIGVAQLLLALAYFRWLGPNRFTLNERGYPLPFDTQFEVGGLVLRTQHVLILTCVPVVAAVLALVLKRTMLGKSIRAVASNRDAASLSGISVHWVSRVTWLLAGGMSAVSAILAAPGQAAFDTQALGPSLLLRAVGAAAIGGFTSLPVAFAAGIGLGAVEGFAFNVFRSGGAGQAAVLGAILVGLFVRSSAVRRAGAETTQRLSAVLPPVRIPDVIADRFFVRRHRVLLVILALLIALAAPSAPFLGAEAKQYLLTVTVVYALVGLSIVLLTGWAGQVSLGQFALLGIGAFTAARLADDGWSILALAAAGGAVAAVAAVIVGLPALRLSGLTLAVTTLGLAVVGPSWLFRQSWLVPEGAVSAPAPRLAGLGDLTTQKSIYFTAVGFLVVAALGLSALKRSPVGRAIAAVRENEAAAASFGLSPTVTKLSVFALSGFVAGSAGALWLAALRNISVELLAPQQSLLMLSIAVVGGVGSIAGAIIGAVVIYAVPALTADSVKAIFSSSLQFQLFLGGGGLLATQLAAPGGIAGIARHGWERVLRAMADTATLRQAKIERGAAEAVLEVEGVTVHFGGRLALDDVSLVVRPREIVGLIGTNGAGKTTLLNAISGTVDVDAGAIRVLGHEVVGLSPELRAHLGLGRSFQDARLFPGLTVRETVLVALQRHAPVGFPSALLGAPWVRAADRSLGSRAEAILDAFGLSAQRDVLTSDLSTGMRRLCDVAAQVAAAPKVLLLDEPTAGVAQREAQAMAPVLQRAANDLGCSMVIIEHDLPLLLSITDRIYCLEAGRIIAEGSPATIRDDPLVVASYLGTRAAASPRQRSQANPERRRSSPLRALTEEPTR